MATPSTSATEDFIMTDVLSLLEAEPTSAPDNVLAASQPDTYVGSKTTDSLIDIFIFLVTKVVGMAVDVKDIDAYQKELRNDYIINKELSNLPGNIALKCGRFLAVANAALITAKHIDLNAHLESKYEAKSEEITEQKTHQLLNNYSEIVSNSSQKNIFSINIFLFSCLKNSNSNRPLKPGL